MGSADFYKPESKKCTRCKIEKPLSEFYGSGFVGSLKSECKVCTLVLNRSWQKKNKDRLKQWRIPRKEKENARAREIRAVDNARHKEASRRSYQKHRDARLAYDKVYYGKNKHRAIAKVALRKSRKLQATPAWSNKTYIEDMYMLAKLVSEFTGTKYHVDHIVPLVSPLVCGLHVPANLQVVEASHNLSKANRSWPEMPSGK